MTDDRLSFVLDVWRDWMREPELGLGYPGTAAGIRWKAADSFDDMCDSADRTTALAVDAAVDSLPQAERIAVHAVVIGPNVWRRREPIQDVYLRAREMLKVALNARGIV